MGSNRTASTTPSEACRAGGVDTAMRPGDDVRESVIKSFCLAVVLVFAFIAAAWSAAVAQDATPAGFFGGDFNAVGTSPVSEEDAKALAGAESAAGLGQAILNARGPLGEYEHWETDQALVRRCVRAARG